MPLGGPRLPHAPGQAGQMKPFSKNLHKEYVCKRCHNPGHHVIDCPTNGDKRFDPSHDRGVPKS